jgi:predicted RNase H-like HicB family nuclease
MSCTAVFQKINEGYIGFVEEISGANSHGATDSIDNGRPGFNSK